MYKVFEKNNDEILHHSFETVSELMDYLKTTKTSQAFRGSHLESMDIEEDDDDWYGTSSLEEAMNFATYGYNKNFDVFIGLKNELDRYIKVSNTRPRQYNHYVGFVPNVKAYLEGSPLSMINWDNPVRKQIDVYYNVAVCCATTTEQIYNRGVIVLSLIELLEKKGFSVNLRLFEMAHSGDQTFYAEFKLKDTCERVNASKLYFPMCHNSWLRRICFRLKEVTPDISGSWTSGYGTPCDDYVVRRTLDLKENDIVIPQPDEIGITGKDIVADTNRVFDYIREYNHDKIELEHIKRLKP